MRPSPDLPRPRRGARRGSCYGAACHGGTRRGRGSAGGVSGAGRSQRQRWRAASATRSQAQAAARTDDLGEGRPPPLPDRRRLQPRRRPDGRFGARRKGHRHQGQDLPAASGTPVVAPDRGVVAAVQYQARGAGHYVVIHSRGLRLRLHAPAAAARRSWPRVSASAPVSASRRSAALASRPARTCTSSSGWAAGSPAATRSTRCRCSQAWSGVSPASG